MKSTLIALGKIAFWLVFLWNIGFLGKMISSFRSEVNIPREQQEEAFRIINDFMKAKLNAAKQEIKEGNNFSPEEYFAIMKEKTIMQDSLHCPMGVLIDRYQPEIQALLDHEMRNDTYSYQEMDRARTESGIEHFHEPPVPSWTKVDIAKWFWHLYLSMLPFVILLFLLWIWEGKEASILSIRSPLCFAILVCIHPFYITGLVIKWWRGIGKSVMAEVELRRRKKNIFARLSAEERSLVTVFAKSGATFKEFIVWAETFGARKHCICIAFIAVIIGSIASQIQAQPQIMSLNVTHVESVQHHGFHSLVKDYDVGLMSCKASAYYESVDWILNPVSIVLAYCWLAFHSMLSNGYSQTREPVPIVY